MNLSDDSLHEKLLSLTREEREVTLQVLRHLRIAEARKLYALRGHSSLFEYAVSELRYSEGSAQRRISAMRLLRELPDLEEKVEAGEIKVTQLSQVQSFLRSEAKSGTEYSVEAKRELILATIGKSTREVAYELMPERAESISVDLETLQVLKEARDRFAHELPHAASMSDVIVFLAKRALRTDPLKKTPLRKKSAPVDKIDPKAADPVKHDVPVEKLAREPSENPSEKVNSPPALAVKKSRAVPAPLKREVWKKDHLGCAFIRSDGKTVWLPAPAPDRSHSSVLPRWKFAGSEKSEAPMRDS